MVAKISFILVFILYVIVTFVISRQWEKYNAEARVSKTSKFVYYFVSLMIFAVAALYIYLM